MQAGESVGCPHCNERTIVKSKKRMDGFTVCGESFVCALCGAELGVPEPEGTFAKPEPLVTDKLAALLGEVALEERADLAPDEAYGRFCRNCGHFIEHPFRTLCGLNGKAADPMGDCARFERKKE